MSVILNIFWKFLQINPELSETIHLWHLKETKTLQEIIGSHTIKNGKVFKTHLEKTKGKCESCNTNKPSLSRDFPTGGMGEFPSQ